MREGNGGMRTGGGGGGGRGDGSTGTGGPGAPGGSLHALLSAGESSSVDPPGPSPLAVFTPDANAFFTPRPL